MLSSRPHLWHLIIIRHHILSVYTRSISTRSNVYSGLLFIAFTLGDKASNLFRLNKKKCQIRIDNHRDGLENDEKKLLFIYLREEMKQDFYPAVLAFILMYMIW